MKQNTGNVKAGKAGKLTPGNKLTLLSVEERRKEKLQYKK